MYARYGICLLTALALPLGAAHASDTPEPTLSPYFLLEGQADGAEPFALESTHVRA